MANMSSQFAGPEAHLRPPSPLDEPPTKGLRSLPLEVELIIANKLHTADLCSLWHAFNTTKISCDHFFRERNCFAHLNCSLRDKDLDYVLEIVQNGALRDHVQTITLSAATFLSPLPGYSCPILGSAMHHLKEYIKDDDWYDMNGIEPVAHLVAIMEEVKTMKNFKGFRVGSTLGVTQLEDGRNGVVYDLKTLPYSMSRNIRELQIHANKGMELFKEEHLSQCISDRHTMNRFLVMIFIALHEAEYSERNVDVCIPFEDERDTFNRSRDAMLTVGNHAFLGGMLTPWFYTGAAVRQMLLRHSEAAMNLMEPPVLKDSLSRGVKACMSRVVRTVHFQDFRPRNIEVSEGSTTPTSKVYQLLYKAVCDEAGRDIHIRMHDSLSGEWIPRLHSTRRLVVPMPIIRHLQLENVYLNCESMIQFLCKQQEHLIGIEMKYVNIDSRYEPGCEEVFKAMQKTGISKLVLKDLTKTIRWGDTLRILRKEFTYSVEVDGRTKVDEFLQACADKLCFNKPTRIGSTVQTRVAFSTQ